jgi:hypothetical protein
MNKKILSLMGLAFVATQLCALKHGLLKFQNTSGQPVSYVFQSKLMGSYPQFGIDFGTEGGTLNGEGTIAPGTTAEISSGMWLGDIMTWGDTIDMKLSINPNNSKRFTINQLGSYTISVDDQNNITLTHIPIMR